MIKKLNNRGDTIVEVLIAMAVLGAVLGGAIISANHNINVTRTSQERAEALKLVEQQLELLKVKSLQDQSAIMPASPSDSFCLDGTDVIKDSDSDWVDKCVEQTPAGGGYTYALSINYNAGIHTVRATWDQIGSSEMNNIEIKYKVVTP